MISTLAYTSITAWLDYYRSPHQVGRDGAGLVPRCLGSRRWSTSNLISDSGIVLTQPKHRSVTYLTASWLLGHQWRLTFYSHKTTLFNPLPTIAVYVNPLPTIAVYVNPLPTIAVHVNPLPTIAVYVNALPTIAGYVKVA